MQLQCIWPSPTGGPVHPIKSGPAHLSSSLSSRYRRRGGRGGHPTAVAAPQPRAIIAPFPSWIRASPEHPRPNPRPFFPFPLSFFSIPMSPTCIHGCAAVVSIELPVPLEDVQESRSFHLHRLHRCIGAEMCERRRPRPSSSPWPPELRRSIRRRSPAPTPNPSA